MDPWRLLEVVTAFFGTASLAVAGWALIRVVTISESLARLEARHEAERDETVRRFDELVGWLKAVADRLDRFIERRE